MWKIRVQIIERERGGEIDWHVNEKKSVLLVCENYI